MLIVRGVNVFPSAVRDVVAGFLPDVSGQIRVRPRVAGVRQDPPLPVAVELSRVGHAPSGLAEAIAERVRATLVVQAKVELVPWGSFERSEYKSSLIDH